MWYLFYCSKSFTSLVFIDSIEHFLDKENTVKGEKRKKGKKELNSTVVLVPGDVDVCLLEAQYVIVHCLTLASWEVVTRV